MAKRATAAKVAEGMLVEEWEIDKVIPYDRNPRTITEKAVTKVAESIKLYGWRQPIVVDAEGVIIVGHTRREAAKRLGLKTVPVHVARDMDPKHARAYRLADNKVAEETGWDKDLLAIELTDLAELNVELADVGFSDDDIAALFTEGWHPILSPEKGRDGVTDRDVDKADKDMKANPKRLAGQELVDVICPHCGATYALDKSAIA